MTAHPLHGAGDAALREQVGARQLAALSSWSRLVEALQAPQLLAEVDAAGVALVEAMRAGGALLVAGNGGSAAIASHIAAEFVGKCIHDRDPLPAINLAESLSAITAVGNDYGYEHTLARGVFAHGRPGDVLLAMTTSGRSPNVIRALEAGRARGMTTIALVGVGGVGLRDRVDHLLVVPSDETPRIQEVHLMWAHGWCEAVDVLCRPS